MKNTHINHPEDSVLTGDLSVLKWFTSKGNLSVKVDGSPAIVWGTNPSTGNFFVGTKSVFNKVKNMVCYTVEDIFNKYNEETHKSVIEILTMCLLYLPKIDGIIQADFIGFGGSNVYRPNTLTYTFSEIISPISVLSMICFPISS